MVLGRHARAAGRIHGNGKLRAEGLAQQGVRNDADIRTQADELHAVDFARREAAAHQLAEGSGAERRLLDPPCLRPDGQAVGQRVAPGLSLYTIDAAEE